MKILILVFGHSGYTFKNFSRMITYLHKKDVLRWGKNVGTPKTRTRRHVGTAVYYRASSLETLIGYLYLTNVNHLEKVMVKLGFLIGVSTQMILEQANGQLTTT